MKCYLCNGQVSRTQIRNGDAHKLSDGTYMHTDCGMKEAKETLKAMGWGGRRAGAGRKSAPEALETISVMLYKRQLDALRERGASISESLRTMIDDAMCHADALTDCGRNEP